jgi:hypothetical protein
MRKEGGLKSITLVVEERHDIYLHSLAERWKRSRSEVLRHILDDAMRRDIDPAGIDQPDSGTDDSDT